MFSLLKTFFGAVLFGAGAYAAFFVDFGGQTLASHVSDVWQTPVVQDKIERVREEVKGEIEQRLAEAGREVTAEVDKRRSSAHDRLTEQDREALDEVLRDEVGSEP